MMVRLRLLTSVILSAPGVEFMVTDELVDLLYRFSDYGSEVYNDAPATVPEVSLTTHTIQAGLHWELQATYELSPTHDYPRESPVASHPRRGFSMFRRGRERSGHRPALSPVRPIAVE